MEGIGEAGSWQLLMWVANGNRVHLSLRHSLRCWADPTSAMAYVLQAQILLLLKVLLLPFAAVRSSIITTVPHMLLLEL